MDRHARIATTLGCVIRQWLSPDSHAVEITTAEDRNVRRRLSLEVGLVLMVSFGASALSAALSLVNSALAPGGLGAQQVALNASRSRVSAVDLGFQLVGIVSLAATGGLALYLLSGSGLGPRAVGLVRPRPRPELTQGLALGLLIGLPGLGLYLAARAIGFNVEVVPTTLSDHWWRLPVLVLWAIVHAFAEETVVVAYLLSRLRRLGWSPNSALWASALLRGGYHLYQGIGGGVGNVVMGLVFGRYWQRTGRLTPLVVAHAGIDTVAFVGYALLSPHLSWLG